MTENSLIGFITIFLLYVFTLFMGYNNIFVISFFMVALLITVALGIIGNERKTRRMKDVSEKTKK